MKVPGYLSIFMSLTLTLILSLCLVLVEGTRHNLIRLEAECILDIGMNSVLAEYHREVLERYNLFFIDSSYGTDYPSYYNTEANIRKYMEKNVSMQEELGVLGGNRLLPGIYMDLLELSFPKIRVTGVSLATDHSGYCFQKQAAQAVEQDIGIGALDKVLEWVRVVEENGLMTNTVEEEIESVEQQLSALQGKKLLENEGWVKSPVENPVETLTGERRKGILNWVAASVLDVSEKAIQPNRYISSRRLEGRMNQGNLPETGALSVYERLLFQEYLFRYAGNYLDVRPGSALDYQVEYLLFGEVYDTDNLRKTAAAICGLRETANMISLLNSAEKKEAINAVASVLAAAVLAPEAAPIFEGIIVIAWTCLESLQDTRVILDGGSVPLLKDDTTWQSDLQSVLDFRREDSGEQTESGLNYEDYLRIFMYLSDSETVTYRFMDVMEMDIRLTEGNEYFRLDGCIDYLEVAATVYSEYGYTYELKHAKGYR